MNRKVVFTLLVLALAVPAGFAIADRGEGPGHRGGPPEGGMPGMHLRMLHRLDLSDKQKEQIQAIREGGKSERLAAHKEINRLQNQLQGEMLEDRPDRRRVVSLAEEIDQTRSKLHVMGIEQWLEIRALLTDEQRDELLAMPRGPHGRHGMKGNQGKQGKRGMRDGRGFKRMMDASDAPQGEDEGS